MGSCTAQQKNKESKIATAPAIYDPSDRDPYFVETQAVTSPYGPTSITRNMIQDRQDNIWFATWEGIICYDGKEFTNFTNKEGLKRFHIFAALEDRQGILWFGSIGAGIFRYDGETFINYTTKDGLAHDSVTNIYEAKDGQLWFGTLEGISIYDPSVEQVSFRNITTVDGLTDNDVNSIIEDKDGLFWIGTRGKACTYDGQVFTEITNAEGQSFYNVRSIIKDQDKNIWLGGNDGLWRYDGKNYSNLSPNFVGYVYEDSQGNIWTSKMGEQGGWTLSRYSNDSLPYELLKPTSILDQQNMLFGILEDTQGGIWVGKLDGIGRYDGVAFDYFKAVIKE